MDGRTGDFGSVGALSGEYTSFRSNFLSLNNIKIFGANYWTEGVKNPIKAAHIILEHGRKPDALSRIPPMFVYNQLNGSVPAHKDLDDDSGPLSLMVLTLLP
jgi:hypothetical protein